MSCAFIISAPSGSGKSTVVEQVLASDPNLLFSISYTTRERRGKEKPGQSYNYISREEFEERIRKDEFLEYAEVFGNYYGTHQGIWQEAQAQGKDLVLDIDVQGAAQLKKKITDAVSVFILAPSRAELEARLRKRSEDPDEVIRRRLAGAAKEIDAYESYGYILVNRKVADSVATLKAIIQAERVRMKRMEKEVQTIRQTFEKRS
jgi:guanylate kinase